jgi:hypothetical protein
MLTVQQSATPNTTRQTTHRTSSLPVRQRQPLLLQRAEWRRRQTKSPQSLVRLRRACAAPPKSGYMQNGLVGEVMGNSESIKTRALPYCAATVPTFQRVHDISAQ